VLDCDLARQSIIGYIDSLARNEKSAAIRLGTRRLLHGAYMWGD